MSASKHNVADIVWVSPREDLQILSLELRAAISEPYLLVAEVKSEAADINFADMLNATAKIHLKVGDSLGANRLLTGIITQLVQGRTRHGNLATASRPVYTYTIEVRPKLWLLTRRYRSRVFQKGTAKDFIATLLDEHGVTANWQVNGSLQLRDYCVQYEESDFHFMSRLLEDEGIGYFFDHEADQVVFTDFPGGFPDCAPVAEAPYVEEISPRMAFGKQEFISDFSYQETMSSGIHVQHHYNYETSQSNINAEFSDGEVPTFSSLETYEHSQNYKDKGEGGRFAQLRQEMAGAGGKLGRGTSTCRSFQVGRCFTMSDHFRDDLNCKWLITTTVMTMEQGAFRCDFGALQAEVPFRPARKTRRPRVNGLQTATITGPAGSKVYLDDMGRCKLQFHWDREGSKDDRASMWVRVSNGYAGKDYGIQWIPRVGHEVVVTFIDGDPDLPLVTGRVYNDFNSAPLGPAKKWQNMIKTIKDTHIIFDDEDGKELLDLRSQKDMTTLVVNNDAQDIGNNRTISVGTNHDETIGQNMSLNVGVDRTQTIGVNHSETIGANMSINVGSNLTESVGLNRADTVGVAMQLSVGAAMNTSIGAANAREVGVNEDVTVGVDRSLSVGANLSEDVGADYSLAVGKDGSISFGKTGNLKTGDNLTIQCDKKAVIDVKDQLTLKCGKASIVMKKNGDIQIKGKNIQVKGSGNIKIKGSKIGEN